MTKPLQKRIAERIRAILDEKGLKQQFLADSTGLGKGYISRIMAGTVNLTVETIELLERALKAPIVRV